MVSTGLIAVIPAPRTAPLVKVLEAVEFARQCREIMRVVVASDQPIETQAAAAGAWFFHAPYDLVAAPTPRLELLSAAGAWCEKKDGETVRLLMHLEPLHPVVDPLVVFECLQRVMVNGFSDGIVGVAPGKGVAERGEYVEADPAGRLQLDLSVFACRSDFAAEAPADWLKEGRFLPYHLTPGAAPRGGFL